MEFNHSKNKYEIMNLIGEGGFGIVYSAVNKETGEKVAIKKITKPLKKGRLMSALREIRILRHLDHENIIGLKDVMISSTVLDDKPSIFLDVRLVYQLMNTDLCNIISSRSIEFYDAHCKYLLVQLLQGLEYLHSRNILHCDLKPENILVDSEFHLKICDFGMSRVVANEESTKVCVEKSIGTNGYRPPEILFNCKKFGTAVDVWSAGCILATLLGRKHLFPRSENALEEIKNIIKVLGNPDDCDLDFIEHEEIVDFVKSQPLSSGSPAFLYPNSNPLGVDLLSKMVTFDPSKRITVAHALQHPYIRHLSSGNNKIYSSPPPPPVEHPEDLDIGIGDEKIRHLIWKEMLHYHPELGAGFCT